MEDKKNYYLFKILYFIRFFADAMFYCYTNLYLESLGLKEGIIGTIASITTITALIVNPIWNILAKDNKVVRILLFIASMIEGTAIILYGNVNKIEGIMLLTAMAAIAAQPYYSMIDSYSGAFCETIGKDYAKIRVMGSLGYVGAVLLCSFLIEGIGYKFTFIIAGALFLLVGFMSFFLPKTERKMEEKKRDYKSIITNKSFWFYIVCYLFIATLGSIIDNFNSLFFTKEIGLSVQEYSYVNVLILLTEVATMFIASKWLQNANRTYLFLFMGIIYSVKSFLMSLTFMPTGFIIFAASLRGIAWGLVLFIHIKNISKLVGLENITSAVILQALVSALFSFGMNNFVGYTIEYYGYTTVYVIDGFVVLLFASLYFFVEKFKKKPLLQNNNIK